jgi:hypothetical protein
MRIIPMSESFSHLSMSELRCKSEKWSKKLTKSVWCVNEL